jgi:hypothetical protein
MKLLQKIYPKTYLNGIQAMKSIEPIILTNQLCQFFSKF